MRIAGFLYRAKVDAAKEVKKGLKVMEEVVSRIERDFVERMFNKFRVVVADLKERIQPLQCTFMEWVTREELQDVIEKFVDQLTDVNDTAVGSSKYKCLLCGKPRTHVSGMMLGLEESDDEGDCGHDVTPGRKIVRLRPCVASSQAQQRTPKRADYTPPRDVV